jgi:hypothetical protein
VIWERSCCRILLFFKFRHGYGRRRLIADYCPSSQVIFERGKFDNQPEMECPCASTELSLHRVLVESQIAATGDPWEPGPS